MPRKQCFARVSTPQGALIKEWRDFEFSGFTKQLNSGVQECVVSLPVPFDYDEADVREGNDVEIIISDVDTAATQIHDSFGLRVIFKGYISLIDRSANSDAERVIVHLLGYYTLLTLDVLKNGDQTTLYSKDSGGLTVTSGDLEPADIGGMARAVIDRFNAERGGQIIFYEPQDVPLAGTDATYTFQQKTYREAIDILKTLAPENVYWYVDERGRFFFKAYPTTPTHTFTFGRECSQVRAQRSLESVRNAVQVWNGASIYKQYADEASIALYGRRASRINDFGISDEDAADAIGAKFLAENKDPAVKLTCLIIDNNNESGLGYDIESIQPGDTCAVAGFSSTLSDIFRENMLITKVVYNLDAVEIEVELVKSGVVDVQANQAKDIADIGNGGLGIPESYS